MDTRADHSPLTPPGRKSGSCVNCSRPDECDDFVQCDHCDSWWHMSCAEVTPTIAERPWTCRKCMSVHIPSHAGSSVKTTSSSAARVALKLKQLEEEREVRRREFQCEKELLRRKYELLESRLEDSEEKSGRSRLSSRTSMEQVKQWIEEHTDGAKTSGKQHPGIPDTVEQSAAGEANQQKDEMEIAAVMQSSVRRQLNGSQRESEIQRRVKHPIGNGAIPKTAPKTIAGQLGNPTSFLPPVSKRNSAPFHPPEIPQGKPHLKDATNKCFAPQSGDNYYKQMITKFENVGLSQKPECTRSFGGEMPPARTMSACFPPGLSYPGNSYANYVPPSKLEGAFMNNINSHYQPNAFTPRDIQSNHQLVPTPSQLAARQVLPRDLPTFTGDPADWPIFISNFMNSTVACGFNDAENLARLQKCLKSVAYESVKSRLLLPESVPHVINTLYLLYGRPELLINALLEKMRTVQPPKAEKLETLIEFGIAVQSLCDHLEAADQQAHLSNPSLLMELVGKLPAHTKMEWATFLQQFEEVNLKTFGMFMSGIVVSASKVTLYSGPRIQKRSDVVDHPKSRGASINAHAANQETVSGPERSCYICHKQGHRVRDCGVFRALTMDNRWKAVQDIGLCRSCLNAHGRRSCRNSSPCGIAGCRFRHHPLLHSNRYDRSTGVADVAGTHTHSLSAQQLLFRILPVTIHGPRKSVTVYAFLDDGSSITLVEEALMKELDLTGEKVPLCLTWTGNVTRMEADSRKMQLIVSNVDSKKKLSLRDVRTVKRLALPSQSLCIDEYTGNYRHLQGLPLVGYENAVPRLLIGINNLALTVPLKVREGRSNEPVAVKTRLGWCIYGGCGTSTKPSLQFHACSCGSDAELHNAVKEYFTLENMGVKLVDNLESAEDKRAKFVLEQTTKRVGDRYETGLLWKRDDVRLPDNYDMALRRLECLERRMERNPLLKENLHKQLAEYQSKGYAHRATEKELSSADPNRVWYLPLGAVIHPKKPEKVRLIWDAAATKSGVSLNTLLLKGPDQLTSLPSVLMRFRQYWVGISADIREMFHQILICSRDRHSQRFLWRSSPSEVPSVFLMDVATFGSSSSPASAQFIKNKNAKEFVDMYPRAVEGILANHYVDDYLDSFQSPEEAIRVSKQIRMIHSKAGFDLRGWQSNSNVVLQSLGEKDAAEEEHLFLDKSQQYERVLGMFWRTEDDVLCFSIQIDTEIRQLIENDVRPTKRQVLKCLMSFFDPLGLASCLLVHGKILLQEIWRTGIQWDQEITVDAWQRWRKWSEALKTINKIRIPRCYFPGANSQRYDQLQLHVFVDASESAYAALAYFRVINPDGKAECSLVATKTRVAPLKPLSIPRLELQAAVLGVRLMNFVLESHTVAVLQRYFWSDSTTVLAWIRVDPLKYKQYVACRIGEILSVSDANEWRWVPSKLNPADLATKWGKGLLLNGEDIWFKGPIFLRHEPEDWPEQNIQRNTEEELRVSLMHSEIPAITPVVEFERFSRWTRLLRAIAFVMRFISNCRKERRIIRFNYLTQEELMRAHNYLIRIVQWQVYPAEMATLSGLGQESRHKQQLVDKRSVLCQLCPFLDENEIMRVDGRVNAAPHADVDSKFPIILPRKHRVTKLILEDYHRRLKHGNAETVVNEVRQQFHVQHLRTVVRQVTQACQWCKIKRAKPSIPRMAPLPLARLASFTRPFTYVGLDFFGPLQVKVGRSSVKRWIALFTCLTIRAVHVEVAFDMTTDSCIHCVRRFVCRRGSPVEIYSDNGTNFVGAERLLTKQIADGLAATFTGTNTKWMFIPPATPHMGGAWERMVRSVKTAMETAYNNDRKLNDDGLQTLVIEAEAIVNSRPLTYLPLDSEESEALSPNHFILGSSNGARQPVASAMDNERALTNSWCLIQQQLDKFWRRWIREYLPTLTKRPKWYGEVKPLAVGDLVLMVEGSSRNSWTRGRVKEVVCGEDGRVRQVYVDTARGVLRRAASKLALLEVYKEGGNPVTCGQSYGGEDVATGGTGSDPQKSEITHSSITPAGNKNRGDS